MTEQQKKDFRVINGNSLEILDTLEENSVDAIITDPPYQLGFMGKSWDSTGIAYNVELWKKALRVLKPCGYLLAFGGTRTFHRIAVAIEDAGFEIRDTIMWLYGSGFPKSMNIGKAIESYETYGNSSTSSKRQFEQNCEGETFIVKQTNNGAMGEIIEQERKNYIPNSENAKKWAGWGTCLKPAFEPIIVARKPTNLTIAKNCLKWGVGGLNIDECRVGNDLIKGGTMPDFDDIGKKQTALGNGHRLSFGQIENAKRIQCDDHFGRFPANVITDGSEEVAMGMPNNKSTTTNSPLLDIRNNNYGNSNKTLDIAYERGYNDEGSALRYFYSTKASKKDRDEGLERFENINATQIIGRKENSKGLVMEGGKQNPFAGKASPNNKNIHPTVKPVGLMQYLVRLITPKGGVVLDIFNGSGSTGKAVAFENRERDANYKYIGIELTPEYVDISLARIDYALNKYEYDLIKEENERKAKGDISLFDFIDEGE